MVVAAVEDDLGRHVLGRAAERPRLAARADSLRKAKVYLQPTTHAGDSPGAHELQETW